MRNDVDFPVVCLVSRQSLLLVLLACRAEPWSKTLGRNASLEYTRDSPMFRKRLWAFQETLKPLEGHTERVLKRAEEYCTVCTVRYDGRLAHAP